MVRQASSLRGKACRFAFTVFTPPQEVTVQRRHQKQPAHPSRALVSPSLIKQINREHARYRTHAVGALRHAVKAGHLLLQAKDRIGHGGWGAWIAAHCHFAPSTVQLFMQLARDPRFANPNGVRDLSVRKARALLRPPRPLEAMQVVLRISEREPQAPRIVLVPQEPAEDVEASEAALEVFKIFDTARQLVRRIQALVERGQLLDENEVKALTGCVDELQGLVGQVRRTSPWEFTDEQARDAWDPPDDDADDESDDWTPGRRPT
jgi:hypothetical protein